MQVLSAARKTMFMLIGVILSAGATQAEMVVEEGFEGDLSAWTIGTDLPEDPNKQSGVVDYQAVIQPDTVFAGGQALKLYIDGRQDDGTVWIQRQIDAVTADEVSLSFRFWSPFKGSFNNLAYVVSYVGPEPPQMEDDFVRVAPMTDVGEWDPLVLSARTDGADSMWAAVGFSVV